MSVGKHLYIGHRDAVFTGSTEPYRADRQTEATVKDRRREVLRSSRERQVADGKQDEYWRGEQVIALTL